MSDLPTPLDPTNPNDADHRESGHVFRRTSNMNGRWCIRCGLSYSRWHGDCCDSPHPDQSVRIDELEAWKVEAMRALTRWDHVAEPIVKGNARYRGWFKWDAVAVELNRIAELEAHVDDLEAMVQQYENMTGIALVRDNDE